MAELDAVDAALSDLKRGAQTDFSTFRSPLEAIVAYLERHGSPRPKKEIIEAILAGGFKVNPTRGKYFFNDTINYHVSTGRLTETDGTISISEKPPLRTRKSL